MSAWRSSSSSRSSPSLRARKNEGVEKEGKNKVKRSCGVEKKKREGRGDDRSGEEG